MVDRMELGDNGVLVEAPGGWWILWRFLRLGLRRFFRAGGPSPLGWRWPGRWPWMRRICKHGPSHCVILACGRGRGSSLGDCSRILRGRWHQQQPCALAKGGGPHTVSGG